MLVRLLLFLLFLLFHFFFIFFLFFCSLLAVFLLLLTSGCSSFFSHFLGMTLAWRNRSFGLPLLSHAADNTHVQTERAVEATASLSGTSNILCCAPRAVLPNAPSLIWSCGAVSVVCTWIGWPMMVLFRCNSARSCHCHVFVSLSPRLSYTGLRGIKAARIGGSSCGF